MNVLKGRNQVSNTCVFGCVCYAKSEASYLRKLDDRSRALVHLGIEPESKAYPLYDPTNCRVVVSRDVTFDEDNEWKWNTTKNETTETRAITFMPYHNEEDNDEKNMSDVVEEADSKAELCD